MQSVVHETEMAANTSKIVSIHQKSTKSPNSPVETKQQHSNHPNGLGNRADTSSARTNVQSVGNDALTAANAQQSIRTCPRNLRMPDLPGKGTRWTLHESNGDGKPVDMSSGCTDIQCVEMDAKTTTYALQIVRTHPNDPKPPNSPSGDAKHDVDEMGGLGSHR